MEDGGRFRSKVQGQKEILIFLHIPKSGGLTLDHVIRRQYPPDTVQWFSFDRPHLLSEFAELTTEERFRLRCVAGHFPFGIHEQLPLKPVYVTVLRDPVERLVSEYGQLKRVARSGRWRPPQSHMESLEDFLDYRIETHATEVQTRFVSGYMPLPGTEPPFDPMPEDALEQAKANLRNHFAFVGLTHRFDESLLLMKRRLGWPGHVYYLRKNAAPRPVAAGTIAPRLRERIAEHTRCDAELVRYATALLDEAVVAEGEAFQRDLRRLHAVNRSLHLLAQGWKWILPAGVRNAVGFRHIRTLVHRVLT